MPIPDEIALNIAKSWGMPLDLYCPIAAKDHEAIIKYVGKVSAVVSRRNSRNALLVDVINTVEINPKLPIWKVPSSMILHAVQQLWVHVDYRNYRAAYKRAFPNHNIDNLVVDHIMNRRVARLKGFNFLRVIAISRAANSSSGNYTEKYAFSYHNSVNGLLFREKNPAFIQYADIADIVKMLDIKTGGQIQEGINECLKYFELNSEN